MRCTLLTLLLCTTTVAVAAPGHDDAPKPRASKAAARHKKHRTVDAKHDRDDAAARDDDGDAKQRGIKHRHDDADAEHGARDEDAPDLDIHTDPAPHEATIGVAATTPTSERYHNELYFVVGAAHVDARAQSGGLQLDAMGIAALAAPMGPVQGSVETDPANIIAGMIGFAPAFTHGYLAIETVFGVPKTSKLRATGDLANKSLAPTALGIVPTGIPPLGSELGEATAVPPMLTAIFRLPALGPLRFYAGGGGSVLFIMDAKVTNKVLTEVATPTLDITPSYGVVGQVGVDIHLFDRFSARIDFKELWFTTATATISNIKVHTTVPLLETVDVGSAKAEFTANPIVVQAGLGATF